MSESGYMDQNDENFTPNLILTLICITELALTAGMTLGYLSIDTMRLRIMKEIGTQEEQLNVFTLFCIAC